MGASDLARRGVGANIWVDRGAGAGADGAGAAAGICGAKMVGIVRLGKFFRVYFAGWRSDRSVRVQARRGSSIGSSEQARAEASPGSHGKRSCVTRAQKQLRIEWACTGKSDNTLRSAHRDGSG